MPVLITDRDLERRLIRRRKRTGIDRWDEVWEGVYHMPPAPNNEHQDLAGELTSILKTVVQRTGRGRALPGVNVSDRRTQWKKNYRVPDVAVYLTTNSAEDRSTHWFGGPDLAIEIISPGEDPHAKLDFYAKVDTRELLVIERDPWRIALLRQKDGRWLPTAVSEVAGDQPGGLLTSATVPFTWRLVPGSDRPRLETTCTESGQVWHV